MTDTGAKTTATHSGLRRIKGLLIGFSSLVPYRIGSKLFYLMFRSARLQDTLFKKYLDRLRLIIHDNKLDVDFQPAAQEYLACNIVLPWRLRALSRLSAEHLARWVRIENLQTFDDLYHSDTGVVLITGHMGATRLVPLILSRMGYNLNYITPLNFSEKMGVKDIENINVIQLPMEDKYRIRQMMQAIRLLKNGEVVGVAADGLQGAGGITKNFFGKSRSFHTSFADLSLRTNSEVIPVFSTIDPKGNIHIEFCPALVRGEAGADTQLGIEQLLRQYISLLEYRWQSRPGSISSRHLESFLEQAS